MKKLLLFALAVSVSLGSFAQMKGTPKLVDKMANSKTKIDSPVTPIQPTPVPSSLNDLKGTQTVERHYIGKSGNVYSVLLEEQRYIDYNEALGLTSFTFRADPATYPDAENSGSIITATSTDMGITWNPTWLLNEGSLGRYPSGVIYNPEGNTDPAQAYISAAGPVTLNNTWVSTFFASSQVNGENLSNALIAVDPDYSGSQLVRSGMQACEDGMVHILTSKYQDNGSGYSTEMNLNIWNGQFNGSGFDWDYVDVPVDLAFRNDGTTKNFWTFGSAWSVDGSVGYAWLIGQTEEMVDDGGYQPVVFMTTDQGENWDEVEVNVEDNEVMAEYLFGTQQNLGPVWPLCSEVDGVVDANNNLQMFVKATGTFSNHPDSIGYSYSGALNYIFNIELSPEGVQNVLFVDSLLADDVAANSENALGNVEGWGTRLKASRTLDGNAIFAVWSDTEDAESFNGENAEPNIKSAGKFVGGNFHDGTFPVTNFTIDDLYAGFYFFINVGEFTEVSGNLYSIPVTTTVTPGEFGSGTELTPVTHNYVSGISYLIDGVSEESALNSNITVAQNQPNPFTGTTTITISSTTVAPVSVEVANMLGQVVYTQNAGTINGTMNIELNASQLEAGVYFYTVRVGADSITKKMIVE